MTNEESIREGNPAPDFSLIRFDHDRFYLNQQKGKSVLLIFWATWCDQCKTALIELNKLSGQNLTKNSAFAAICTDPENMDDVRKIAKELNLRFPILLDNNAKIFKRYNLNAFPTILLIDPNGNISMIRLGYNQAILHQIKRKLEHLQNPLGISK